MKKIELFPFNVDSRHGGNLGCWPYKLHVLLYPLLKWTIEALDLHWRAVDKKRN